MDKKRNYTKKCKMCHKRKNLWNFYVDKNQGDKLDPFCKKCRDKMNESREQIL